MSKRIIIIWLAVFVVLIAGVVLWGSQSIVMCWDGIEVDEPLLMDLCGITREEYFSLDFKFEDCPQSEEAVYMIGGCEPDWPSIMMFVVGFALIYLLLSGLGAGVWFLKERRANRS